MNYCTVKRGLEDISVKNLAASKKSWSNDLERLKGNIIDAAQEIIQERNKMIKLKIQAEDAETEEGM